MNYLGGNFMLASAKEERELMSERFEFANNSKEDQDELLIGEDWKILICPRCGFDYLHQGLVRIFNRKEDQPVQITSIYNGEVHIQSGHLGGENPSPRRQGLAISFECEGCHEDVCMELCILQHKGQTYLHWR